MVVAAATAPVESTTRKLESDESRLIKFYTMDCIRPHRGNIVHKACTQILSAAMVGNKRKRKSLVEVSAREKTVPEVHVMAPVTSRRVGVVMGSVALCGLSF